MVKRLVTTRLTIMRRSLNFIQQNFADLWRRGLLRGAGLRFGQRGRWLEVASLGAIALLSVASLSLAAPDSGLRSGLRLSVSPNAAVLGDTLSAIVEANGEPAPILSMNGKTYPTFRQGDRLRALLPTTPLSPPGTLQIEVVRGEESARTTVKLKNRRFPTQSIWLPPGKDGNIDDREYDIVDAFKQIVTPEKLWNGPFRRPNAGPTTTGYGVRRYYNGVFAKDYFHRGVDYAGNYGSPVLAAATGRVALIGREAEGFRVHGNTIGLDHGQGVETIYIHLSRINVQQGDLVQAGQVIGALGDTGAATGPHLHWGLYVQGQCVDPVPWRERGFE
jgi:murein DD-endopeptidase MepM/ murein hydrolase activator NlpD